MTIINKSGKIVNIGQKAVMPGDPATIDDSFANNEVIKLLIAQGILATGKKAATKNDAAAEAKKKAEEEAAAKKAAEEAAAKGPAGSGSK